LKTAPLRRLARWLNGPRYSRIEVLIAVVVGYVLAWLVLA